MIGSERDAWIAYQSKTSKEWTDKISCTIPSTIRLFELQISQQEMWCISFFQNKDIEYIEKHIEYSYVL